MQNYKQGKGRNRDTSPKSVSGFARRFLALAVPGIATVKVEDRPHQQEPARPMRELRRHHGATARRTPLTGPHTAIPNLHWGTGERPYFPHPLAGLGVSPTGRILGIDLARTPALFYSNFLLDTANHLIQNHRHALFLALAYGAGPVTLQRIVGSDRKAEIERKLGGRRPGQVIRRPHRSVAGIFVIDVVMEDGEIVRKVVDTSKGEMK